MQGRPSTMIPLNPFDRRARPDPYPIYQYMRTVEPVHRSPVGFWVLTRYVDCLAVLEDPRWSHNADRLLEPARGENDPVDLTVRLLRATVAFLDGPGHVRHRRALESAVRTEMRGMAGRVADAAEGLLRLLRERESKADLVSDYAGPLSIVVVSELLGLPQSDRAALLKLCDELASGIDPDIQPQAVMTAGAAAAAMVEYMLDRLDHARPSADGGVVGELAARRRISRTWELVADLCVLLVIGVVTVRNLIANATLALVRSQDQLQALRARPALMESGLEELIRFDGPLHLTARSANEDVELAGHRIAGGDQALVLLAAANRDPERFSEPDRLNLARDDNAHLGFGAGTHSCFAAPLARQVGRQAILRLVESQARIELDGDPVWSPTVTMRGLRKLPVRLEW